VIVAGDLFVEAQIMQNDDEDFDGGACSMDDIFDMMRQARERQSQEIAWATSEDRSTHVCMGSSCPFAESNSDGDIVCRISGAVLSRCIVDNPFDRMTAHNCDDDGVSYRRKGDKSIHRRIDNAAASRAAHRCAETLKDEVGEASSERSLLWGSSTIAAAAVVPNSVQKPNSSKYAKMTPIRKCRQQLPRKITLAQVMHQQAIEVIESLTSNMRRKQTLKSICVPATSASSIRPCQDCSETDVFLATATKYVRRCRLDGRPIRLNEIHNIELNVKLAMQLHAKQSNAHKSAVEKTKNYIRLRDLAAQLSVTLWVCLIHNSNSKTRRKPGDGFRPFAAGVFFSFRRGFTLKDGTVLIPKCDALAQALPIVRSEHTDRKSHANHLSAHRGVRTLHRCICNMSDGEAQTVFGPAIKAAKSMRSTSAASI
jgi:hypothetical protein